MSVRGILRRVGRGKEREGGVESGGVWGGMVVCGVLDTKDRLLVEPELLTLRVIVWHPGYNCIPQTVP